MVELNRGVLLGGRYSIMEPGRGSGSGEGATFRVHDAKLARILSARILAEDTVLKGLKENQLRVAGAVSGISHPNVAAVHDSGTDESGISFIVMDEHDGTDFASVIKGRGILAWKDARPVFLQACEGLAALHGIGLIHRGVAPKNILLREDAAGIRAQLDGYLAGRLNGADFLDEFTFMGFPEYASPEQTKGKAHHNPRMDLYSLGLVIYESVTGVLPFRSANVLEMLFGRVHETAENPRSHNSAISPRLDDAIMRALAYEPERRFRDALEMRDALERA